jgi:hypothetical protein
MKFVMLMCGVLFSTASLAWVEPDVRAFLPERNGTEAYDELSEVIAEIGILLTGDDQDDEVAEMLCEEHFTTSWGLTLIHEDVPVVVLCSNKQGLTIEQQVETLKHEMFHIVQWCNSGKPSSIKEIEPMGWDVTDFTKNAFLHSAIAYEPEEIMIEAEANTFAQTTSILGVAKTLSRYCR